MCPLFRDGMRVHFRQRIAQCVISPAVEQWALAMASSSEKKLDASKLKVGDAMSRIQYMKVVRIGATSVTVQDETGFEWDIGKSILEAQAYTADQFTETVKVSRTELARIMEMEVRDSIFSCCFSKLPNADDQEKALANADLSTAAKRKRVAKEISVGAERVLVGHVTDTHELARKMMTHLDHSPSFLF